MDVVELRELGPEDLAPLLDAESQAWRTALHWDYTASVRLISSCLAEKRLPGYALVQHQRVAGYCFYVQEGQKALIGGLFVDGDGTRGDAAALLLDNVIMTLLATPGVRRIEAQIPHFAAADLEACFGAHDFRTYLRHFMFLSLGGPRGTLGSPHPPAPEFTIERWQRHHDRAAAQLIQETYRGHVDSAINDQYASAAGASRLIENIIELQGCGEQLPRASLVAVRQPGHRLAGLVALTAVGGGTAHIPQVAVAREFQGMGLGSALLERAFREVERLGFCEVSLTVTDLNEGAARLYEHLGFRTFRTFGAFVWSRASAPGVD